MPERLVPGLEWLARVRAWLVRKVLGSERAQPGSGLWVPELVWLVQREPARPELARAWLAPALGLGLGRPEPGLWVRAPVQAASAWSVLGLEPARAEPEVLVQQAPGQQAPVPEQSVPEPARLGRGEPALELEQLVPVRE